MQKNTDPSKKLVWKPGAKCQVLIGKHKDLYGAIEAIDGDTDRIYINLAISKASVSVPRAGVILIAEEDYLKNSKYLNKAEVDNYKKREEGEQVKISKIPRSELRKQWLIPNLSVKFLDKRYQDGEFYGTKATISRISSSDCICTLITKDQIEIKDVRIKYVETTVPERGEEVKMLDEKHFNETAIVVKRISKESLAHVLLHGRIYEMDFDCICAMSNL
ncbi:hypothetical protein Ciccas_012297 [Cichlidogyrus casuarinus]|uniref:KOW domain-containing protein n=1 Tax=Cichlidogyrus casuarinus TaxID=1844966 RepID=A0ABD2PPH7_9PLAT